MSEKETVTYSQPEWVYEGKIIEPAFCMYFVQTYEIICVSGILYTIEGRVEDGVLKHLAVKPESRRADVVVVPARR